MSTTEQADLPVFPGQMVDAMRYSAYHNTAYALAELVDNSVQAEATNIEIFCSERRERINKNMGTRISRIAVLDDGTGMQPEILQQACQFGNGTRLNDRRGIGRFGMGLPSSSISQCERMDIWTWQSGPDNAVRTHLDAQEIRRIGNAMVPTPQPCPLPQEWRELSHGIGTSGTLVAWTKLLPDRMTWHRAAATLSNTELLIGRIHRKFIDQGKVAIRLVSIGADGRITDDRPTRANDPLYLMKNSNTSPPYDKEPMFQEWGKPEVFKMERGDEKHEVRVQVSWAKAETVPATGVRGAQPYGRDAGKNIGVSLVRADRELLLDAQWASGYDPVDRWWGVEVSFPPALDELFGVTKEKQGAVQFQGMAKFSLEEAREDGESNTDTEARLRAMGDPKGFLSPVARHIRKQIELARERLDEQTKGTRPGRTRHTDASPAPTVEDAATKGFKQREAGGTEVAKDKETFGTPEAEYLTKELVEEGIDNTMATRIAETVLSREWKVLFSAKPMLDSPVFFSTDNTVPGLTRIILNKKHPMYEHLIRALEPEVQASEQIPEEDLLASLQSAHRAIHLMLAAWARYELEEPNKEEQLAEFRQEWGKMVRLFLREEGE